jgi:hypothetical protein
VVKPIIMGGAGLLGSGRRPDLESWRRLVSRDLRDKSVGMRKKEQVTSSSLLYTLHRDGRAWRVCALKIQATSLAIRL